MSRRAARLSRLVLLLLGVGAALPETACGGAKHAKIAGPPPEYEPPEPFDAGPAAAPTASRPDAAPR